MPTELMILQNLSRKINDKEENVVFSIFFSSFFFFRAEGGRMSIVLRTVETGCRRKSYRLPHSMRFGQNIRKHCFIF